MVKEGINMGEDSRKKYKNSSGAHIKKYSAIKQFTKELEPEHMSDEYTKYKRTKLWWRALFIVAICGIMVALFVLIFRASENKDREIDSKNQKIELTEQELVSQIDELKTKNMELEYELSKYKEKYGELTTTSDENAEEDNE